MDLHLLNDSLGHDIGDLLLIEIARKLKDNLNKNIEMMARIERRRICNFN